MISEEEDQNGSTGMETEEEGEEEDDFEEETYEGSVNDKGEPHGRGTLFFDKSRDNKFQGRFVEGVKHGRGCFYFADGSSLEGNFQNDSLQGKGLYTFEDGSYSVGHYVDGELNGQAEEFDSNHRLTFKGSYKENVRTGLCHFYDENGGHLFGCVDKEGKISGKDFVYSYPDGATFLKGIFKDGEMVDAQLAIYCGIGDKANPHSYSKVKSSIRCKKDVSSLDVISTQPMCTDPYEQKRVYVRKSLILDANEGLFASIDAGENEVMSFYNGVRVPHSVVDARDWKYNDNTISLDQEIVIDVPAEFSSTTSYKASLGHKANHSFTPNCKYDRFDNHPRFGRIKCIRTIQPVRAGDELTVAYGYDHNKLETDAPEWYKEKLKQFQKLFRRMQPF